MVKSVREHGVASAQQSPEEGRDRRILLPHRRAAKDRPAWRLRKRIGGWFECALSFLVFGEGILYLAVQDCVDQRVLDAIAASVTKLEA